MIFVGRDVSTCSTLTTLDLYDDEDDVIDDDDEYDVDDVAQERTKDQATDVSQRATGSGTRTREEPRFNTREVVKVSGKWTNRRSCRMAWRCDEKYSLGRSVSMPSRRR